MPAPVLPDLHAPLLEWAQWYAAQGWPVFPCHGKVPITTHGFQDASLDPFAIAIWWQKYPDANIGSPAGLQWWALDVDPRAGGDDTLFDLERQHGTLPHTLLSHTGGGGSHYLWALPPEGIQNKAQIGTGLDIQGHGSYIILPPSIHPDTHKAYAWDLVDGPDDIMPQPAPDWLLTLITHAAQNGRYGPTPLPINAKIPVGERDDTLAYHGAKMAHDGYSENVIYAALTALNTDQCEVPLSDADIQRIAHSVSRYQRPIMIQQAPVAPGWSLNGSLPMPAPAPPDWRAHLGVKKSGGLIQDVRNISLILEHHEFWRGQLWWDDVSSRPMWGSKLIDDDTIVGIGRWLGTEEALSVTNLRMVERCVLSRCRTNKHDVMQHWLTTLPPWDQTPRLTTWLTEYAGVEPTVYGQDVSRLLILAMVARAMEPGCLCRHVVILEGPEEVGKSSLVQALAGDDWYVVLSIGLDSKDSHMMLQGVWVAEMAELDSLSRTEETRLKAFITMRYDSYIPKYSNFRESHPRRAIFVGTTNEESYLKGQTGNTRFLPVKVTRHIDIEGFRFVRNQLFAEALLVYHSIPRWWELSVEGQDAANEERERRRLVNVYEQPLHEWLEYGRFATAYYDENQLVPFTQGETSWAEIARWYLQLKTPAEWKDINLQKQVTQSLKTLGWRQEIIWRHGRTSRIWKKEF